MNSFNDFWQAMSGQDISPFEEILLTKGAIVMTPEEPLFAVFAMMVRVLHQSQGEAEKALLKFAPELTDRAQAMIRSAEGLERQLDSLLRRGQEMSSLLRTLEAGSVGASLGRGQSRAGYVKWVQRNVGPVATTALVLAFCIGFVLASYVSAA